MGDYGWSVNFGTRRRMQFQFQWCGGPEPRQKIIHLHCLHPLHSWISASFRIGALQDLKDTQRQKAPAVEWPLP